MLDVDHFKRFNDQHGHEAGDHVLRTVVDVLRRTVREEDLVCRYGGEEFVILLPEVALETARARAQAVVDACRAQPVTVQGQLVDGVTVSIGLAMSAPDGSDGRELVRRADAALYAAKRAGRDRVVEAQSLDTPTGAMAA
jgi:diguanylate cyclase (GGDEF)-like protein